MGARRRVTLLAGGVGGAKMAEGLAALDDVALTVIGNIADDEEFYGLRVSPDIDTLTYTLAGKVDRARGWGLADDRQGALSMLRDLGAETWMTLGDRDFGLHIYRSFQLENGCRPCEIAADIARALGAAARIILPTDDKVRTRIRTSTGWLAFQEYFVREHCQPKVLEIAYEGLAQARPSPEALAAINTAESIIIAPSNPLVSIAPIIGIAGILPALAATPALVVAVSPLIAGRVVKGPADRMMRDLGMQATAFGVAEHYRNFVDMMVIDHADGALADRITALGMACAQEDILMNAHSDKTRLAAKLLDLVDRHMQRGSAA